MFYSIIFYLLSFILICFSIMVISVKNPVHSVFSLIGCFIITAGLFIIIGAEYVAMTLIIVYVGAVAVLFLFVIMMLDIRRSEINEGFLKYAPLIILLFIILAGDLYIFFDESLRFEVKFAKISVPTNYNLVSNTKSIGSVLYTDYLIAFQLAGLILFISMISTISLTHRNQKKSLKQDKNRQLNRNKSNSIEIVKVRIGEGV